MNIQKNKSGRTGRPSFEKSSGLETSVFRTEAKRIILSRQAKLPLWQQLADQLENLIYRGKIAPGSRIPSEPALCELFDVSKSVVRAAISALAAKGLVNKLPRTGMFVGKPPQQTDILTTNLNLFDDMLARGVKIRTVTFDIQRASPDEAEANFLQLEPDQDVVRIGRIFWLDDKPFTYTHMSFPHNKVAGLEDMEIEGQSILGLVREKFGREAYRADRWLSAKMPSQAVADGMGVPIDRPLIWVESIAFEADGSPLEFYRAYYNSDTARIHISVSG